MRGVRFTCMIFLFMDEASRDRFVTEERESEPRSRGLLVALWWPFGWTSSNVLKDCEMWPLFPHISLNMVT